MTSIEKHPVDWAGVWRSMTEEVARKSTVEYWNSRAADYNDYILSSGFDHGRSALRIIQEEGILIKNDKALDIAAGPGSLSIPLAEAGFNVTALEPSDTMGEYLVENAFRKGLDSIELVLSTWQDVDISPWRDSFDLVICSQALWHFPDLMDQVVRMEEVSRGWCGVLLGVDDEPEFADLYRALGLRDEEPDRFLIFFNLLYSHGRFADVRTFQTVMKRSKGSAFSMWEKCAEKFGTLSAADKKNISNHIERCTVDGLYTTTNTMALIWWPVNA
jgi:SAM-dependent methyltransferase